MPPSCGKARVAALQGLDDRYTVEDGEVGDRGGMIHGGAERGEAAAIMADDGKAVEAKLAHECNAVPALARLEEPA